MGRPFVVGYVRKHKVGITADHVLIEGNPRMFPRKVSPSTSVINESTDGPEKVQSYSFYRVTAC